MIEVDMAFVMKPTFITTKIHAKPPPARLPTAKPPSACAMLNVASRHCHWQRRPAEAPAEGDTPHLPSQINRTTPEI